MADSIGMSDSTGMSGSTIETEDTPRRAGYQCRVPPDVLKKILSFLALDVSNGLNQGGDNGKAANDFPHDDTLFRNSSTNALKAVQSTSSEIYLIATPYLYRTLWISNVGMISLLQVFGDIGCVHEVIAQDRDADSHPLDFHLYHRLRWALSLVQQIHLTIYPDRDMSESLLDEYTGICTALRVFGRPPMWSKLEKVSIRVRDIHWKETPTAQSYACFPYGSAFMRAIGPTLHPTFLDIELPDPPRDKHFEANPNNIWSLLHSMRADHVTVSSLTDESQGIPSARLSLTLEFSPKCGTLVPGFVSHPSDALIQRCFILEYVLPCPPRLTLIGLERGLERLPVNHVRKWLGRAISNIDCSDGEARYRIKPWNSLEGEDWNIWYSYDEPFGEHFCDPHFEGNEDDDDDSVPERTVTGNDSYAEAAYEVIQKEVKRDMYAIKAKTTSTDRRIDAMNKRITTLVKTTDSTTDSMACMKRDIAAIMAMMKEMASKGKKGKTRSRFRRYKEERMSKKTGRRGRRPRKGLVG